ncbi:MAG: alpha/beta hydrolase, partial [Acidobacteriota bacterium]|nr:alpha/beta hydrolase [Acidobacteriota bacterium]
MRDRASETTILVNGQSLTVWQWAGDSPPLVLCHATGFHGRCWDQIVARLPGRHCIALDFRGHGRSSKPAPPYSWRAFGDDLAAILAALNIRDAVGVGHSMGGHSLVHAAAGMPQAFSRLVLLDPVIRPRPAYT